MVAAQSLRMTATPWRPASPPFLRPSLGVPVLTPAEGAPPSSKTTPLNPLRLSVAPLLTVVAPVEVLPVTDRVPALTVVVPV